MGPLEALAAWYSRNCNGTGKISTASKFPRSTTLVGRSNRPSWDSTRRG